MAMRKFFFFLFLISTHSLMEGKVLRVSSQAQFDAVVEQINKGEEVTIELKKGQYLLSKVVSAKAPLKIKGKNATIIGFNDLQTILIDIYNNLFEISTRVGEDDDFWFYKINEDITPYSLFFDEKGTILDVSESVEEGTMVNLALDGLFPESNMKAGTIIKIPIADNLNHLKNHVFSRAFGYFDCGWQTVNFLLEKSDKEYFYCKTLNNCRTGNYSYDKRSYKKPVRYVIYNAEKRADKIFYDNKYLYIPKNKEIVYQVKCSDYNRPESPFLVHSDLIIKGVSFCGIDGIEVHSPASTICVIESCKFLNSLGYGLRIIKEGGKDVRTASIKNCYFESCSLLSGTVLHLQSSCEGGNAIALTNSVICRYPNDIVGYKNVDGAVYADGNIALINNVVFNTCRDHLYFNRGHITAKGNLLYNTDKFNSYVNRNLSCDWGLIYCNHVFSDTEDALTNKTHQIIVHNNLLYGACSFRNDARGIYIDDGRGDVVCKDNVILDVDFLSMDSRNVSLQNASSVRNVFEGNIVSTKYKLMGGPAVNGDDVPVIAGNIVLNPQSDNIVSNAKIEREDQNLNVDLVITKKEGKLILGNNLRKIVKRSSAWGSIKKYVNKK